MNLMKISMHMNITVNKIMNIFKMQGRASMLLYKWNKIKRIRVRIVRPMIIKCMKSEELHLLEGKLKF